ncbi:unnamed protein product [Ectocarpus sp. 4 AP-2014]
MGPMQISYPSLEFKNQLRDGVAPIEACAFNTPRREFLAVDASALRVWSLKRVVKTIMAPNKVSSPAIAAFCWEKNDLYIVVYGGRNFAGSGTSRGDDHGGGCFVYDAKLRLLCRFSPCDCEVSSAAFHPSTGALIISGRDGILRVFRISSRQLPPAPVPHGTTATKPLQQVTAREVQSMDGPTNGVAMQVLEIDADSGLVVGLNGTEAFLWRLPPHQQTSVDVPMRGSVGEVEVPTLPNTTLGGDANDVFEGRRYQYLGSMPDLHSSEVTAIGVREPLLATGLANGRIFLWRITAPSSCSLKRVVLAVFDAHDAFPILTLRLLRSRGASDQGVTSPSSPAAPHAGELKSSKGVDASSGVINNGGGGSSEDWSIISGGGDGTVAHLSVVGLASAREAASGVGEAGVELRMIGDYEASRKTRSADYTSGSATSGDRVGNGQSAANRRPGLSHIMAIRLSAGKEAGVFDSGVDARRTAPDTAGRGTLLSTGKGGENFPAPAKGSSWAEVIASARGKSGGGGSGRDFCVAVSGGLISVLEVVEPLQHVGWVGRKTTAALTAGVYGGGEKKREVARMARVPSVWRSARGKDVDCAADDFMVMCDDGWFGWYHGYHGRFELVSRLTLTAPGGSHFVETTAAGSDTTCFAVCPIPAVSRNTSANDSVVSSKYSLYAGAPESARIVVGYSDGSIACASLPAPSSSTNHPLPTFGTGSRHHEGERGERTVRRLRRAGGGGGGGDGGGGAAIEAAITALCPLSAPLVVAGDSDGRLALWTTSSALPPDGRQVPLLWEDRNAHSGVVIAIERVEEATPSTRASGLSCNGSTHTAHHTSRPREWVVSVGSGGEIRVWNVPSRWPGGAAAGRVRDSGGGLEFCATLLTNSSICSFSCALLLPSGDACIGDGGGINGCGGNGGLGQVLCEDQKLEKSQEQGTMGEKRRCRPGARPGTGQAEAIRGRLYCVAGSDNGFVQAWELSLDGEKGVGGQPLWSQKTHDAAVTKMDMWELNPSDSDGPKARKTTGLKTSSSTTTSVSEIHAKGPRAALVVHQQKEKENHAGLQSNEAPPPPPPHCQAVGKGGRRSAVKLVENSATECLVLSAALDRTLCVFRARYGRGLHLLRRLNVPCYPRGLPGALFVGIPVERASEVVAGTQLKAVVVLAAAGGELTQLGIEYKIGGKGLKRPSHARFLARHDSVGDPCSLSDDTTMHGTEAARGRGQPSTPGKASPFATAEEQSMRPASTVPSGRSILDKVPKWNTPPTADTTTWPRTAARTAGGNRPFLEGAQPSISSSGPPDISRPRSANYVGGGRGYRQHLDKQQQQHPGTPAAADEVDMMGHWDYPSSESYASGATVSGTLIHPAIKGSAAPVSTAFSVADSSATLDSSGTGNEQSKAGAALSATGGADGASGADSQGDRGAKRLRPEARESGIRGQPGPQRQRSCIGKLKKKKLKNGGGRCGGGDGNGDGFDATQQTVNSLGALSTGITKDGFAGNAGRWQQRLGITVEGDSNGPGENGGDEGSPPHEATTARELMEDAALREAFATRGRHKKSPVLAREVKATLKAWSPGVVEACSRADFSAAMGDLTSRETVSFQRVCEIAAAVLEATGRVATRRAAGQGIGCKSVAASSKIASRQGNNARRRDHHPLLSAKQCDSRSRPARYRNMAKFKTRLQYNSMGERVVVRVAVGDIDAFAARSRQGSHLVQDQQKQQHRQGFDGGASGWGPQAVQPDGEGNSTVTDNNNEDSNDTSSSNGLGDGDRKAFGGEGRVSIDEECVECDLDGRQASPPSLPPKNVSKSLGFGWPDFSSVDSKACVADHMYSEDDLDSLARPSRATAANLGCVPAGLRGVWSRQGSCMFSSWSASHHAERPADQLPAKGTDGNAEVMREGECVRLVREVLDGRAAAREASLMACRRLGRCARDSHAIVVGDGIYSDSSRGEKCGATACFDQEEDGSCCPASSVETLGVALYRDFRRRYGLQRTAEERVAGLLGAVLEHGPASPVLRLFARMVGAPAGASGEGGRWPSQTPSEDANLGLEPQLVNLVTAARNWLITRGFMTTDGPWAGVGKNGKTMRDSGFGIGWRTTIVARTHAAMCASALLTPGWGAGHQIMGAAEQQAVLELPTVTPSGPGVRRWAGRRGQQPWSEFVDGEAFLEALLLVVLCARNLASTANDGLFGRRAVAGHSFLLAKARDINAGVSAAATEHEKHAAQVGRKTATERSLESLFDTVSKTPPHLLAAPASGEYYRTNIAPSGDSSGRDIKGVGSGDFRGNQAGDARTEGEPVDPNQNNDDDNEDNSNSNNNSSENSPVGNNNPSDTEEQVRGRARGTRFRKRENELGEGGKVLQRLKPLLDNFIREDTQRTGTLPAADFRRVLCEGHGALWPGLGTSVRSDIGFVLIPEECAAEFIDPRLTSPENDAARALVRRFMDVFDGQACYLDVWITLYHAVFRTGKIVPFTELPPICEMQLRGADTEHWRALLEYLETAGIGNATPNHYISERSNGEAGEREDWPVGVRALSRRGQPSGSTLDHSGKDALKQEEGEFASSHVSTMARGSSTPTLGLLRTVINGGAASSHTVTAGTAARRPRPSTVANNAPATAKPTKGPVEWPLVGWGPGSLTVSHPPRAARPSETALSTAAVTLALNAPGIHGGEGEGVCGAAGALEELGLESEGVRVGGGGVVADGPTCVEGGGILEEGNPTRSPHHSPTHIQMQFSSQPLAGERSWDGGGGAGGREGSREGHQKVENDTSVVREKGDRIDHQLLTDERGGKTVHPSECAAGETSDGGKKKEVTNYDTDCHSIVATEGGGYVDGDGILVQKCNGVEEERRLKNQQEQQQQQQQEEQPHQQTSREFSDAGMTEGIAIIPETPVDRGQSGFTGRGQEPRDVPGDEGNGGDHSRKNNRGVDWSEYAPHSGYDQDRHQSQQAYPSRFDEDSMSGDVLLYNLDCGTLEPPSPQPPSPDQQGGGRDNVGTERGQQSTGIGRRKKRREKRTMTSLYVRCPFLDPVKSKHAYRVPRGGQLNAPPPMPVFREAVDSASMAAQLYSSIASVKAYKAGADSTVHAERQDLGSRGRKDKNRSRHRDAGGGTGEPLELHFPQSLKEATRREGSSKSRERRHDKAGRYTPGPGGGGGRGGEEAHMVAAEDREPWTGQRQRRKSTDVGAASSEPPTAGDVEAEILASAVEDNLLIEGRRGVVLAGTATGKRVVSPKASRSPAHTRGGGIGRRLQSPGFTSPRPREPPTRPLTAASGEPGNTSPATKAATTSGTVNEQDPSDAITPNVDGEPPAGKAPPPTAAGQMRRARGRERRGSAGRRGRGRGRGRRGPETTGDSDDDSDDDVQGGSGVDAKKASQQRIIEAMMAEQAAKRRASGDAMKRLIAEEEERKRLRKAEEEAERIAQEKAKQELEERQRRGLEERRKALAKKRADLEEKNRRLEEEQLKKEAERQAADQDRREANEVRRREEAARKAEEERAAREEEARLAKEEEEKLKREEDERLAEAEEALKRAAVERERAREAGEQQRMAQHDEDIDIVLRANVAIVQEEAKLEREAAVREAEELERVAKDAKRKHACLLMSKADEESVLWNERWQMEDVVVKGELQDVKEKKKRARSRVVRDEHGNPVDIRLWEMECTAQTDGAGRLVQQESYVDGNGGYTFDPRDVFQGEGGGIGGRGGGRGDGTTLPDTAGTSAEGGTEEQEEGTSDGEDETCLDAEGLLERERRWMEGIFAASRPDDLSCLFQDSTGSGTNSPDAFSPMVLSERVAWPEYMNMVRAALVAQADAIIKQGAAREASSGTRGGNGACDGNGGGSDEGRTHAVTSSSENITSVLNPSQRLQTPGNAHEFVAQGGHGSGGGSDIVRGEEQQRSTARKTENMSDVVRSRDPSGAVAAAGAAESISGAYPPPMTSPSHRSEQRAATTGPEVKIRPVKLGRTMRGTTDVGPESWALFRFDLPSTGVIVTVVLEVDDGDPEIMVTRGVLPSLGPDETARYGGGVSGWKSSSTQRDLHVVKIFPRDTNFGPGEYFVGVVSRGMPSRFRLRVSTASPADEISTHMRTATAIVDNLAVMSNMDPHRLVKDFVGARLEAEETVRNQRAAALLDRVVDSPEATLDASHRKSLPLDETISGRRPHDQGLLEHHQRPDSSSGSEQHALRPGPAEGSSPASDARHHVVSSAVTPSSSAGDETPRSGAAARDLCNEGAPRTDGEQWLSGAAPVALTALRQRERALASPVAVLDDRMARARPTGLLATVQPASVSVSTLVSHSAPVPAADPTCFDRGSDEDVVHDNATRAVAFGAELRGNAAAAASNAAAVAATHGRYRYGQRRRRMSVPLLASLAGGDEDAGFLGSGARARGMRRPWTTPHGEGEAEVILREEGEEDSNGGGVVVRPFRYSVRRLDLTHCNELRLSDLRIQHTSLPGITSVASEGAPEDVGHAGCSSTVGRVETSKEIRRSASTPYSKPAHTSYAPRDCAAASRSRMRVQSAPTGHLGDAATGDEADWRPKGHKPPVGGDVFRFGLEQAVVPRVSSPSSTNSSPWPSASHQLSLGTGTPAPQVSRTSALSSGLGADSRSGLEAVRAEREAVEAEARQAMARTEPNLFPEIIVASLPAGDAGFGNVMRGRRGWVAGA